jgi:Flp pilus assembly protein protease CpaA
MSRMTVSTRLVMLLLVLGAVAAIVGGSPWGPN